jgi:PhnB protein
LVSISPYASRTNRSDLEDMMPSNVKPIPDDSSVVMPRLFCRDPGTELEFCKSVLGAEERVRRPGPNGSISHALITIGAAMIMIESEWPNFANRAPQPDGSSPVAIFVYVEDVDTVAERAAANGAKIITPPANQFWGDRICWIMDPSFHVWTVASRVEETTEEQRQERLQKLLAGLPWE